MAVQDNQQSLATKAGISLATAKLLSGADLMQRAVFNQAGKSHTDKLGTTSILVAYPASKNLGL